MSEQLGSRCEEEVVVAGDRHAPAPSQCSPRGDPAQRARSAGVAAAVAGVLAGGAVAPEQPLMEAGLGALELRNALQARFGVSLSATAMFDFPTAAALAAHVHAALAPSEVRRMIGHPHTWPVESFQWLQERGSRRLWPEAMLPPCPSCTVRG